MNFSMHRSCFGFSVSDFHEFSPVHLIFYDYCDNSRLTLAAEKLRSQLTIFSNLYETQSEPQQRIGQMHRQIFETYKNGDIIKAGDLMKQHLEDSLQYALSCL